MKSARNMALAALFRSFSVDEWKCLSTDPEFRATLRGIRCLDQVEEAIKVGLELLWLKAIFSGPSLGDAGPGH